jgi:hypothetical protein
VRAPSILLYANVDSLNERLELAVAPPPKHRNRRAVAAYDAQSPASHRARNRVASLRIPDLDCCSARSNRRSAL